MRFGRCLAAGGVLALVVLTVVGARPAYAAPPTLQITAPGAGDVETSAAHVTGSVSQNGGTITSVTLSIVSDDGWGSPAADQTYNGTTSNAVFTNTSVDNDASVSFNWTVNPPARNGQYTVKVSAKTHANGALGSGTDYSPSATRTFSFKLVPAKVTGIAAGWDNEAAKKARVTWKANPEPDIAFYRVLRSYANGNPSKVADVAPVANPTYVDDLNGKAAGQYKYQVQAVRHARTGTGCQATPSPDACAEGVTGLPSAYSAPVTVGGTGVTAPPPTTTTTKKPSTGGGGSSGGTSGGTSGGSSGGTSGATSGGTSGGTAGGTRGTSSGSSAFKNQGGFAPGGTVDLSDFAALLNGNGKTTHTTDPLDEGTYDPTLKYDANGNPIQSDSNNDESLISIGGHSVPRPSDDWIRFIGAGSLATALLVHVLWFKQQVDRLPLEPIVD